MAFYLELLMTDKTQPEAGSTHIIRYALELGLLWIDGDGRDKVREALDALDILEAELEAVGAGGLQALSAAPAEQQVASSAVLKAIREANMQLVRTGDDEFMLVPCKVATTGAALGVAPGVTYANKPDAVAWLAEYGGGVFTSAQLLEFADRTHALRMEQAAPKAAPGEPVHGDVLPPVGSRVYIRHGRDNDAHACTVTGYYAWGDLGGDKRLHRVFVQLVYEGTDRQQARMLCDCYPTAEAALAQAAPQQEAQEPTEIPEEIERMAADRYKVVPSHESMFHRWAVVAGTGTQQLYLGREVECQNMARKFAGAFLDGAFVAMQRTAPQPAPAPLSDDTKRLAWMADEWTPGHEKLYDKHVLETGGVGGLDDLRTFIDKQIAAQRGK